MDKAVEALGDYKAKNQHMHIGPKAHVLHFPVAGQTLMNVVAFVTDLGEWNDDEKMVEPAYRSDVQAAFEDWAPTVRSIVSLLPEEVDKWAVFDSFDCPAPYYNLGRVCIAGDAAHASSPHHGAGAGIGIEDALCLATLLEKASEARKEHRANVEGVVSLAFDVFNAVRKERSQWLVNSSRGICEVYEWADPLTGDDPERCLKEIEWRSHKIWYFDYEGMLVEASESYEKRIQAVSEPMSRDIGPVEGVAHQEISLIAPITG
jgi:salicylate hydroxylase